MERGNALGSVTKTDARIPIKIPASCRNVLKKDKRQISVLLVPVFLFHKKFKKQIILGKTNVGVQNLFGKKVVVRRTYYSRNSYERNPFFNDVLGEHSLFIFPAIWYTDVRIKKEGDHVLHCVI